MSLFVLAALLDLGRESALQMERDTRALMSLKTQIEKSLVDRLRLTDGIAAFIKVVKTVDAKILDPYFEELVTYDDPVFRNIAVMKGTVIGYQFPLAGNEKSIGVDLLTVPEQRDAILKAMTGLEPTINGPIELVQGGRGLVMRVPIALEANNPNTFWGQISIVLRYDELFAEIEKNARLEGYHISIAQLDGLGNERQVIFRSDQYHPSHATIDIPIMTEMWRVGIHRELPRLWTYITFLFMALGLSVSVLLSWIINKWMLQRDSLNSEVDERTRQLRDTNEILEQYVAEFEEKQAELEMVNGQLEQSLDDLKDAQDQLVVTEKLAALGDLVASLAHEINTPLGVCVTLYSFVEENLEQFKHRHLDMEQPLHRSDLQKFLEDNKEALMLMGHNLKRSSELVASFKLVSMDQYLEEYRIVNVSEYIDEIVNSIRPKYKRIDNMLVLTIDPEIRMYTYPGAISQILTNLINNSVIHGFNGQQEGQIRLSIEKIDSDSVVFKYCDSGVGLDQEGKENIFKPFYTTKKHKGSSGLGMHIVFNAVVKTLGGKIELMPLERGFGVTITLPIRVEKDT